MRKKISNIESTLNMSDKILLSITIIAILITFIMACMAIENIKDKKISEIENYLNTETMNCAEEIESFFENKFDQLELLASLKEVYEMNWSEQYEMLKGKAQILNLTNVFIVDNDGYGYYVDENVIRDQKEEVFIDDINRLERYISEPYLEYENDKAIITLSQAIYKENIRVGTICATVKLDDINKWVGSNSIKENANEFIVNERGEYIVADDLSLVYDGISIFNQEGYEIEFSKYKVKDKYGIIFINGEEHYASYESLKSVPWNVVCIISKDEVLNEVKSIEILQYSVIVLLIILIILIIRIIVKFIRNYNMVYLDSLTEIFNRNKCEYIFTRLDIDVTTNIGLIAIDLNDFKKINDTMGHNRGDEVLKDFSKILKKVFGKIGFVGRMGGDEFIVILRSVNEEEIEKLLNELSDNIDEFNESVYDELKLSACCGYAIRQKGEMIPIKIVYSKADENMYDNKSKYKERV